MGEELTVTQQIEQSIVKDFRHELWRPFSQAIKEYQLIQPGDRIAVCISGGKDSMLMSKLLQEYQRHAREKFELVFLVMDPGYDVVNRQKIEENLRLLGIPATIFESDVFDASQAAARNPCYLCARMRRGCLYNKAEELGCNKIALGHHFNDVVETTMIGLLYGAQIQAMRPKLHAKNHPGMELIRPMYMIHEEHVIAWAQANGLSFIACACRMTRATAADNDVSASKRKEVKLLLRKLRDTNPDVERSIFRAIHKCDVDTMVGYRLHGVEHSFLEAYDAWDTED